MQVLPTRGQIWVNQHRPTIVEARKRPLMPEPPEPEALAPVAVLRSPRCSGAG